MGSGLVESGGHRGSFIRDGVVQRRSNFSEAIGEDWAPIAPVSLHKSNRRAKITPSAILGRTRVHGDHTPRNRGNRGI